MASDVITKTDELQQLRQAHHRKRPRTLSPSTASDIISKTDEPQRQARHRQRPRTSSARPRHRHTAGPSWRAFLAAARPSTIHIQRPRSPPETAGHRATAAPTTKPAATTTKAARGPPPGMAGHRATAAPTSKPADMTTKAARGPPPEHQRPGAARSQQRRKAKARIHTCP